MKRTLVKGIVASSLLATSLTVLAEPTCTDAPESDWMSQDQMKQQIADAGYKVKEFKTTDGSCYEIYGWDDQERRVEIYFNPVNGDIVKKEVD
ncbi:PepSY domain-containing protein [Halomonas sp. 25-S5]|uniref:PepSY domain-containing protein n=1 Tax=Halomonas sp. 25-S5 TaxID=2994065 RepID=UPI002468E2D1|nr:PepSY domain-containing protein [Halomonas sp. 25-S5]